MFDEFIYIYYCQHNVDLSAHFSEVKHCYVSKLSTTPVRGHHVMRYWIKPTAVRKRNYLILQEVLHSNQTTSPPVKGNGFWSTCVTRNSTIQIVATVCCDTLINKTLHVKRIRYTDFQRRYAAVSVLHEIIIFFSPPEKCIWVLFEIFQPLPHVHRKAHVKGYKQAVLTFRC